MHLSSRATV